MEKSWPQYQMVAADALVLCFTRLEAAMILPYDANFFSNIVDLLSIWWQTITWTNADLLLIRP